MRLGGEEEENAERAHRQKFVHKPQDQKKTDRQNEEERFPEAGEFAHFHGGQEPETPEERDRQQNEAGHTGTRQSPRQCLRSAGTDHSPEAEKRQKNARDVAGGLEREMIDHAKTGEDGCMTGVPYKLNPVASAI